MTKYKLNEDKRLTKSMNKDKYFTVEEFSNQLHAYIDRLEKKYKNSNHYNYEQEHQLQD